MKILEKLGKKNKDVYSVRPPVIACLGDSVTQGCFEIYQTSDVTLQTVFDQSGAYHAHLKRILGQMFPSAPINIINAGISGDNADNATGRLDRDVLSFSPDLVIICFGLNDSASGENGVERYGNCMKKLVMRCKEAGAEVIIMTPNAVSDKLSPHVVNMGQPFVKKCVEANIKIYDDGVLDLYVEKARAVAKECGVPLCDVYAKWKALSAAGADLNDLLANRVNHPTVAMNEFAAYALINTMLEN